MEGLSVIRAAGQVTSLSWLLILLGEAEAKLGQPLEGLQYVAEATRLIESGPERIAEAELYRVRGDLLNATRDQGSAEESYQRECVALCPFHLAPCREGVAAPGDGTKDCLGFSAGCGECQPSFEVHPPPARNS